MSNFYLHYQKPRAGHQERNSDALAKELVVEAEESRHEGNGAWRLVFGPTYTQERLRERQLPEGAVLRVRREGLDELFDRLTKGSGHNE